MSTRTDTGITETTKSDNGRRIAVPWRRRRKFTPGGIERSASFYAKLIYGIIGLSFLIFTALTAGLENENAMQPSQPPTSWYFAWMNFSAEPSEAAEPYESGGGLFDEPDPLYIITTEEDNRESSADSEQDAAEKYSWGTDDRHHNIRALMGMGAQKYLFNGALAGLMAIILGIVGATLAEWVVRPRFPLPYRPAPWQEAISSAGWSVFHIADYIPKLILLIVVYGGLGSFADDTFTLAMGVFLAFGPAGLFRERLRTYLSSEQYVYAVELGLSPTRIYFDHFIKRRILPLLKVQIPFLLSLFVMYEATLYFFNLGSGGKDSWGKLILDNRPRIAWEEVINGTMSLWTALGDTWSFMIPMLSLVLVVSALYMLGDALREGSVTDRP